MSVCLSLSLFLSLSSMNISSGEDLIIIIIIIIILSFPCLNYSVVFVSCLDPSSIELTLGTILGDNPQRWDLEICLAVHLGLKAGLNYLPIGSGILVMYGMQ